MKKQDFITELTEIFQSSNINFLFGAGISRNFLPVLGNIEKDIESAIKDNNQDKQINGYKEYLKIMLLTKKIFESGFLTEKILNENGEILKNKNGIDRTGEVDFNDTKQNYANFVKSIARLISERESTILSKQINIFTTNIDPLFEVTFEDLYIDYSDGFSGRLNPYFSLSNFKKSLYQRSLHFDHKSEIPVFNLFKIHGSLTWKYEDKSIEDKSNSKIVLSRDLKHYDDTLISLDGDDFINEYKKSILVVNPESSKFAETVLNKYYYELLRVYSSELERENSVLFVAGFSMDDQHIREITQRAAKSNPTLRIFIFMYSSGKEEEMKIKMEIEKYPNITIVPNSFEGEEGIHYDLDYIANEVFSKINLKSKKDIYGK